MSDAVAHGGSIETVAQASYLSVSEVEALTGPICVIPALGEAFTWATCGL